MTITKRRKWTRRRPRTRRRTMITIISQLWDLIETWRFG